MVERLSVCLSVCLSHRSTAGAACGGFAAERPAGRTYRLIAGAAVISSNVAVARRTAANAGSVVLTAELTRLNTDLF